MKMLRHNYRDFEPKKRLVFVGPEARDAEAASTKAKIAAVDAVGAPALNDMQREMNKKVEDLKSVDLKSQDVNALCQKAMAETGAVCDRYVSKLLANLDPKDTAVNAIRKEYADALRATKADTDTRIAHNLGVSEQTLASIREATGEKFRVEVGKIAISSPTIVMPEVVIPYTAKGGPDYVVPTVVIKSGPDIVLPEVVMQVDKADQLAANVSDQLTNLQYNADRKASITVGDLQVVVYAPAAPGSGPRVFPEHNPNLGLPRMLTSVDNDSLARDIVKAVQSKKGPPSGPQVAARA